MKQCKDCKKTKPLSAFYGVQGECKSCTQKRVSVNYHKNKEHYREYEKKRFNNPERKKKILEYQKKARVKNKGKNRARQIINELIRTGKLTKKPCEVCGNIKSEAHHPDYRKPLLVKWLCFKHHRQEHGQVI